MKPSLVGGVCAGSFVLLAAIGCQHGINGAHLRVPPAQGAPAGDPNGAAAKALETAALKAMAARHRLDAPIPVAFPAGTTEETARHVVADAGAPFVMPDQASGAPAVEVRSLDARGASATVRIASKGAAGVPAETDVALVHYGDVHGWNWHTPGEAAPASVPESAAGPDGTSVALEDEAPAAGNTTWFERQVERGYFWNEAIEKEASKSQGK